MDSDRRRISTPELVALIAFSMSLVAMSIDAMLPALGVIAADLGADAPNDRQLILTLFFAGITAGQIGYGPLCDAIGRKRAMYAGTAILALGAFLCLFATSFRMMLVGRLIGGLGAAGARIVPLAIVRDLYEGRAMARIMSFVTVIFIAVPIVAPSIGQGMMHLTSWRGVFALLAAMTLLVLAWFALRLPETLPPERRRPLALRPVMSALAEVFRTRQTIAYTIAAGLIFAALVAYLATAQQIFGEQYGRGDAFPLYFAVLALSVGVSSLLNARLVMRFGMIVLSSAALYAASAASAVFLVIAVLCAGQPPLWSFMSYLLVIFFCNGLLFGNFNALALEPMGHIAGSAAAVVGSLTSLVSVSIGTPIGRAYDGTVIPLVAGLLAMTLAALAVTMLAGPNPRVIRMKPP